MQPQVTLKNGNIVLLSDETYEAVLQLLEKPSVQIEPSNSIDELEEEFAELFSADGASVDDLLEEHSLEIEREKRKLELFD
jgi:hypothetical protein